MVTKLLTALKNGVIYVVGLTIALFFAFFLYGAAMNWVVSSCIHNPSSGWCTWSILQVGAGGDE